METLNVSVILPVYNGVKTLKVTLDSLKKQTFLDFELVCCIDGSNDGSEELINTYKTEFKVLRVIRNEVNLGLGQTMNRLMSTAKGEYVAIAEQDDYYYPDRLQLQVDVLDHNTDVGIVSGMSEFWNGEKVVFKFPDLLQSGGKYPPKGEDLFLLNYKHQIKVVNSCMMIRKSTHINNGLYFSKHYPSISVDWSYILRFSLVSNIYGINKVLVRLDRRNERNSVTSNKTKQFLATRELLRSFKYEYPEIVTDSIYNYALRTQYVMEMNHLPMFRYLRQCFLNILKCPSEKRYYMSFSKKIKTKLGK